MTYGQLPAVPGLDRATAERGAGKPRSGKFGTVSAQSRDKPLTLPTQAAYPLAPKQMLSHDNIDE
jgi:hypothetical protein